MNDQPQPSPSSTVEEFCQRHKIGRSSFYDLLSRGEAPRSYKIGKSRRITAGAEAAWLAAREAEAE